MNTDNGRILNNLTAEELRELSMTKPNSDNLVGIFADDMTIKQKETNQVSLKDHRSKLGKKLTVIRRNDLCSCGSKIKYKKCCLKNQNNG